LLVTGISIARFAGIAKNELYFVGFMHFGCFAERGRNVSDPPLGLASSLMNVLLDDAPTTHTSAPIKSRSRQQLNVPADVAMTVLMLPVTLILCRRWSVEPNWDLNEYVRSAVAVTVVAMVIAAVVGLVGCLVRRVLDAAPRTSSANRFEGPKLISMVFVSLVLLLACSWVYSHVKVGVLFGPSHDDLLRRWDRAICLGHDGWQVARGTVPQVAAGLLHVVYMLFLPVVMSGAYWLSLQREYGRARKLTMAVITGYYLGVLAYFTLPSYGPAFVYDEAGCHEISPAAHRIQSLLLDATNRVHTDAATAQVHAWRYIAAFPSLHFSHVLILCWFLRRNRVDFALATSFATLTAISTIYLGWHYIVDLLGGIPIAAASILIAERIPLISFPWPRWFSVGTVPER
jgi:hypothetical protein